MNQKKATGKQQSGGTQDEEGEYNGDLAFLNRWSSDQISTMQPMFKNEGRGWVRSDMAAEYEGKWQPAVGTYQPQYNSI